MFSFLEASQRATAQVIGGIRLNLITQEVRGRAASFATTSIADGASSLGIFREFSRKPIYRGNFFQSTIIPVKPGGSTSDSLLVPLLFTATLTAGTLAVASVASYERCNVSPLGKLSTLRTALLRPFELRKVYSFGPVQIELPRAPDLVSWGIIAGNVTIWSLWLASSKSGRSAYALRRFMDRYFVLHSNQIRGLGLPLLGCCFSHQELFHLLGNAMALSHLVPPLAQEFGWEHFLALFASAGEL